MKTGVVITKGWMGMLKSATMVIDLLKTMGCATSLYDINQDPPETFDLLVLYEQFKPHWLAKGRKKVLVPNQEIFSRDLVRYLGELDLVLTKTRHAQEIFTSLGASSRYVGFMSEDHYDAQIKKDFSRWVHVAGTSILKGTAEILETWKANADLPTLSIYVRWSELVAQKNFKFPALPNLRIIKEKISEKELIRIQNEVGMHLCPSAAEGWNHTMVEAMGTKSVVFTTDGPPMNEHIQPDRGILCGYTQTKHMNCGVFFRVSPVHLAQRIREANALSLEKKEELGTNARNYFLTLEPSFKDAFTREIQKLLDQPPSSL